MKNKNHFIPSIIKSGLRIGGCILGLVYNSLFMFSMAFLIAELFGIIEEFVDLK